MQTTMYEGRISHLEFRTQPYSTTTTSCSIFKAGVLLKGTGVEFGTLVSHDDMTLSLPTHLKAQAFNGMHDFRGAFSFLHLRHGYRDGAATGLTVLHRINTCIFGRSLDGLSFSAWWTFSRCEEGSCIFSKSSISHDRTETTCIIMTIWPDVHSRLYQYRQRSASYVAYLAA